MEYKNRSVAKKSLNALASYTARLIRGVRGCTKTNLVNDSQVFGSLRAKTGYHLGFNFSKLLKVSDTLSSTNYGTDNVPSPKLLNCGAVFQIVELLVFISKNPPPFFKIESLSFCRTPSHL